MSALDLDYNEDQFAIADAVARFCENSCDRETVKALAGQFPKQQWQELAAMGLFSPATPEGADMGGGLEIAAINESLGAFVFPGPVSATYLAAQVLPDELRQEVVEGKSIVSVSHAGDDLLPWGMEADIFLLVDDADIYLAESPEEKNKTKLDTLGGEPWARVDSPLKKQQKLENSERGLIINNIAIAAFLTGAGMQFVRETSEYAETRKQFGKALGEFQAVAHPLADCLIGLTAAQQLYRAAANTFDEQNFERSREFANGALLSAQRAALNTAYNCHQVYAAIGITLEGPAFHFSRRIRQLATQAPSNTLAKQQLLNSIGMGA